jgi:recombination protein RecT
LLEEVQRRKSDLAVYLPEGVKAERFMALARRAIMETPELADCTANSVLRALRECAISGLELGSGFSSLIVRKPKNGKPIAVWSASYRGLTWQALATGMVRAVESQVVRERDEFSVELGTEPKLVHKPTITSERGSVIAAYAVAELTSGGKLVELLTREDISRIRAMSPAERGPWSAWDDEMSKKACIRRILKRLPAGNTRAVQTRPSFDAPRYADPRPALLPEDEHAMECSALEQLANATSMAEIDVAWHAAQLAFGQRGASVPLSVEARWRDLREALAASAS